MTETRNSSVFLPTPSARRATAKALYPNDQPHISIHAPREGSDYGDSVCAGPKEPQAGAHPFAGGF